MWQNDVTDGDAEETSAGNTICIQDVYSTDRADGKTGLAANRIERRIN